MSSFDEKFITRLDDFTRALGFVTESLKESLKKGDSDPINKMLSQTSDKIDYIVNEIRNISKNTTKIETNTNTILSEIKALKEQRGGGFGEIVEDKNKNKIKDAIAIIGLMAVGIIAMGLALKIVSPVSLVSAVAIGLAMVMISGSFVIVHKNLGEEFDIKRALTISKLMLIMSGTLMISSIILSLSTKLSFEKAMSITFVALAIGSSLYFISKALKNIDLKPSDYLKFMMLPIVVPIVAFSIWIASMILSSIPILTMRQALTAVFVAATIGVSIYAISKALENTKIGPKDIVGFLLLPIIVPALAFGIVMASEILSNVKTLTFKQMFSSVFTAVTIGILVYLMKPLINKIKELSLKDVLTAGLLVVGLAAGLVAASWVLSATYIFTFKEALGIVFTGAAVGLSVLMLTPAVYILKKLNYEDVLKSAKNIVVLAGAVALSSILLSVGMYDNVPDWEWSVGAGLAILEFSGLAYLIHTKMKMDTKDMFKAAGMVLIISAVVATSSWILNFGNYDNYPDLRWSFGVGISLLSFGVGMVALGLVFRALGPEAWAAVGIGAIVTLGVAGIILATSLILGLGNYEDYPSLGWSMGVGLSLVAFGAGMMALGAIILSTGGLAAGAMALGALAVLGVAGTMVLSSLILSRGTYDEYPSFDWASGVGLSLMTFGVSMAILGNPIMMALMFLGSMSILKVANTITEVANILSTGNYEGGPSLMWAMGVGSLLGLVGTSMILTALIPNKVLDWGKESMERIAQTIVNVSTILSTGNYVGGPTEEWSKGVGGSIMAFAIGFNALSESGGGFMSKIFGGGGGDPTWKILSLARTMVLASQIIAEGNWTGSHPSESWAKGVGGSIAAFADGYAKLTTSGGGLLGKIFGTGSDPVKIIVGLARAIVAAAEEFDKRDWSKSTNYPSEKWTKGVGDAINAFANPISELSKNDVGSRGIKRYMEHIIDSIIYAADELNDTNWNSVIYPSKVWSDGVSSAINSFIKVLIDIEKGDIGKSDIKNLNRVIDSILLTGEKLNGRDIFNNFPDIAWSNGVGNSLKVFLKHLIEIEKNDIGRSDVRNLKYLLNSIIDIGKKFSENPGIWTNKPDPNWGTDVGKSLNSFMSILIKIDESGIGRGEFRNLKRLIDVMIESSDKFAGIIWTGPDSTWATNVGTSLNAFLEKIILMEKRDIGKGELKNFGLVLNQMFHTARKFSKEPDIWKTYPDTTWGTSVGASLSLFVGFLMLIKKSDVGINDTTNLNRVINSMFFVAKRFNDGGSKMWTIYPSNDWSISVKTALDIFVNSLVGLRNANISTADVANLNTTINMMFNLASRFSSADATIWSNVPPKPWVDSVNVAISSFVGNLMNLKGNEILYSDVSNLNNITRMMMFLAKEFSSADATIWSNVPPQPWVDSVNGVINSFVENLLNLKGNEIVDTDISKLYKISSIIMWLANEFSSSDAAIWSNVPPQPWVNSVNQAVNGFVNSLLTISQNGITDTSGLYYIIRSIVDTSKMFDDATWSNYPSTAWSEGVKRSIESFVQSINLLSSGNQDFYKLIVAGDVMVDFARTINRISRYADLFTPGGTMDNFTTSIAKLIENLPSESETSPMVSLSGSLEKIGGLGVSSAFSILLLSKSISRLGESLEDLNLESIEKLSKLSSGIMVLSLIDDKKLEDTIKLLRDQGNNISSILSDQTTATRSYAPTYGFENRVKTPEETTATVSDKQNKFYEEMLKSVQNIEGYNKKMSEIKPVSEEDMIPSEPRSGFKLW